MNEDRIFARLEKEIAWLEAENDSLRKRIKIREDHIVSNLIKNKIVGDKMVYPDWIVNRAIELGRKKDKIINVWDAGSYYTNQEILEQIKKELEDNR